jgi:hypothetical protein
MNHSDAVQEMAVERYLLGELSGESLDRFEDHLFDCLECAADLKAGLAFIDGARVELRESVDVVIPAKSWLGRFTAPWVLGPALAACALVIGVQNLVVMPRIRGEVATANNPAILNTLVLASAGSRGDGVAQISAPEHGAFLLSVDVPGRAGFASYECSLYSPSGALVWQAPISLQQAADSVVIHVPTDKTAEGLNTLVVQGLPAGEGASGKLVDLTRYTFQLKVLK